MGESGGGERLGRGGGAGTPARKKRSVGVTPLTRKTKQVYQIAFSFQGVECREVIDLPHTKGNETYCTRLRAEIMGKIARGAFVYAEHFPDSPRLVRFGGERRKMQTLADAFGRYRLHAERTLEPSTWAAYRRDIDNVLVPRFGAIEVGALTRADVRQFIGEQTVSLKRLQNLLMPLRNVLAQAADDGLIETSPMVGLDVKRLVTPAQRETDYEPRPYSMLELLTVLANLSGTERWTFQAWAFTGLRTGELTGLRWRSIDLDASTLRVADVTTVGVDKARTKTAAGARTIPLLPAARQAVEELQAITGSAGPDGRVTTNPRGRRADPYWDPNKLERVWKMAHAGTDVEPRNPYQLRHTFASQLLSQGENAAHIAKLLGHATTEMVIRNYGRWIEQGERLGEDRAPRRFGMSPL